MKVIYQINQIENLYICVSKTNWYKRDWYKTVTDPIKPYQNLWAEIIEKHDKWPISRGGGRSDKKNTFLGLDFLWLMVRVSPECFHLLLEGPVRSYSPLTNIIMLCKDSLTFNGDCEDFYKKVASCSLGLINNDNFLNYSAIFNQF